MGLMLDRNTLNELSRNFANRLFGEFEEWESQAAGLSGEGETQGGALRVTVPQPGSERVLSICTENGEIRVEYAMWHEHIGSFMGITDAEAIEKALDLIQQIIAERSVVKVRYRDGKWSGSWLEETPCDLAPEAGATTAVYSWRGTYDCTL
jgi:hypothetical protein